MNDRAAETRAEDVRVLTITISDRMKRHADQTGKQIDDELTRAGYNVVRHMVLADEPEMIRDVVSCIVSDNESDVIVLSGGTGINPRDQTFEALEGLYTKKIHGFGEAFRRMAIDAAGAPAMFLRASAGVSNQCLIFSLPGDPQTALLGVTQLIVPTLAHAVDLALGRKTHTTGAVVTRATRSA